VTHKKVKKAKKTKKSKRRSSSSRKDGAEESDSSEEDESNAKSEDTPAADSSKDELPSGSADIWRENQQTTEEKSRDEEFEEYLQDLFL